MIMINNLQVSPNLDNITVDVTPDSGCFISKVLFWNEDTYNDISTAIDLSSLLTNSAQEVFNITPLQVGEDDFSGLFFIQFTFDSLDVNAPCADILLEPVYTVGNLIKYEECILDKLLKLTVKGCDVVNESDASCKNCKSDPMIISTFLKTLKETIKYNLIDEAIDISKKIKELCTGCGSCGISFDPTNNNSINTGVYITNNIITV